MLKPMFDVEHSINMFADGFVVLPAAQIYDKEVAEKHRDIAKRCHIYMIGLMPHLDLKKMEQRGRSLVCKLEIAGTVVIREVDLPDNFNLKWRDGLYFIENDEGQKIGPNIQKLYADAVTFKVEYIGQSYGKNAGRNAMQRLLKHETLQEISLKGQPEGYHLYVLLLELIDANRNITMFFPDATDTSTSQQRIEAGTRKLFETTEKERISLFEAAFIRYFRPRFNKEFKESFPSTNMKMLADCYNKDFQAVVAEICIDEMPFMIYSDHIKPAPYHIAHHNLHKEEARNHFFFGDAE